MAGLANTSVMQEVLVKIGFRDLAIVVPIDVLVH